MPPNGEISQDIIHTEPEDGRRRRGAGDVCGVLPIRVDISGKTGVGVHVKGTQYGKTQRALHVQKLEVPNINSTGGTNATPMVRPMWDAYDGG